MGHFQKEIKIEYTLLPNDVLFCFVLFCFVVVGVEKREREIKRKKKMKKRGGNERSVIS